MAGLTEATGWALALGLLGAVFGSFIATVAVRWPESAVTGRSRCDGCSRRLSGWELIPLIGWIVVRGRCRTCRARIAWLHPAVESLGLAIGASAGYLAPGAEGVAGAVFGWLLLALGAIDVRTYRLPHTLTSALAVGGLASGTLGLSPDLTDRAIGGLFGFASLWAVAVSYKRLRGRTGIGGGDPRMFGAIGLWLGWRGLAPTMLGAALLGLAVALMTRKQWRESQPLGPFLAASGFAVWLAYHASP